MYQMEQMTVPRSSMLARARRERHERERRERVETFLFALMLLAMLAAFALAGTIDLADRTEGLGASMVPSAAWLAGE